MTTDHKRQTTLRVFCSNLPDWHRQYQRMQRCETLDALITLHGPPGRKVRREGFEIWYYPLGVEEGMNYSIHVSVWPDGPKQVFFYFEPTSGGHPPRRQWWQFWKKKDSTAA
jgi:hypothetical protein